VYACDGIKYSPERGDGEDKKSSRTNFSPEAINASMWAKTDMLLEPRLSSDGRSNTLLITSSHGPVPVRKLDVDGVRKVGMDGDGK